MGSLLCLMFTYVLSRTITPEVEPIEDDSLRDTLGYKAIYIYSEQLNLSGNKAIASFFSLFEYIS